MNTEVVRVLSYVGVGLGFVAVLVLLDALLLRLANRFAGQVGQYRQRMGTQLPRVIR